MAEASLMRDALVYLSAAVICVPIAKRAGLGSVLGYLVAGCVIGPWGLRLISDVEAIRHFSEFGVVLMLFLIGLELDLKRLVQLQRAVFGGGTLQMTLCGALLAGALWLAGLAGWAGVIAGLTLAMSSTAMVLQVMSERNLSHTPAGRAAFAILLFQDIAAIPLLALIPMVGASAAQMSWRDALWAIGAIGLVILIGRVLTLPLMRLIARADVREVFTAFALLLVIGIAELMTMADLSMALGAFLAGVLLASSEYRHALEADIAPFKGLLLGLFFIAVGMSVDFGLMGRAPLMLFAMVTGLVVLKALAVALIAPWLQVPRAERLLLAALLAQGSEFAFVVLGVARAARVLPGDWEALLTASVALSMGLTPLLVLAHDRLIARRARRAASVADALEDGLAEHRAPVIIAGFGRYGQIVGRLLMAQGWRVTVLDHDPDQIETVRRFGYKVFYGDATRLDLLQAAGADEARLIVVAIDNVDDSLALIDKLREHFPRLAIVARARNVRHWLELRERGVQAVERETFSSALRSGRQALEILGLDPYEARQVAEAFRRANLATLHGMVPHFHEEDKMVDMAKSGRAELEENLKQDALARTHQGDGWR